MAKNVSFSLYIHIDGEVEVEDYKGDPNELLNAILPDGWVGEVRDVFIDPSFMPNGYVEVTDCDENNDEDDSFEY